MHGILYQRSLLRPVVEYPKVLQVRDLPHQVIPEHSYPVPPMVLPLSSWSNRSMFSRERISTNDEFRNWWNQWVATLARLRGTGANLGGSAHNLQNRQVLPVQSRKVCCAWLSYIA
jgi:hypothetical protein